MHLRSLFLLSFILLVWCFPVNAQIVSARYFNPTNEYGHGVLPGGEYKSIEFTLSTGEVVTHSAEGAVFEDTKPRLFDVNQDGQVEVIAVKSYFDKGAAIVVFGVAKNRQNSEVSAIDILVESPAIGQPFRWLGIIGIGDLDQDGNVEIAYVDRPHLAKTLRILRYTTDLKGDATLAEIAKRSGFSNHRIGDRHISGGLRNCGNEIEMITANTDWSRIMASQIKNNQIISRDIGKIGDQRSFETALDCRKN